MKRVLVTGSFGFVGRHAARAAARKGCFVTGIGHGAWGRNEWREWGIHEWHTADVGLDSLLTYATRPELILHCAGSGSVGFSVTNPQQDFQRTVGGTLSVLEYIRLHASEARLVLPSSAGVYGAVAAQPIKVAGPLNPVSPYGWHKKIAEELCISYARNFGVRAAVVRLFSIYGAGLRKQLLWDACLKLTSGDSLFNGTGLETRDWLHVEDAAELLWLAGQSASADCPIVNGGTGQARSIASVLERLMQALELNGKPAFRGDTRPGDPAFYEADISEALALGWAPSRDINTQLEDYASWFLSEVI